MKQVPINTIYRKFPTSVLYAWPLTFTWSTQIKVQVGAWHKRKFYFRGSVLPWCRNHDIPMGMVLSSLQGKWQMGINVYQTLRALLNILNELHLTFYESSSESQLTRFTCSLNYFSSSTSVSWLSHKLGFMHMPCDRMTRHTYNTSSQASSYSSERMYVPCTPLSYTSSQASSYSSEHMYVTIIHLTISHQLQLWTYVCTLHPTVSPSWRYIGAFLILIFWWPFFLLRFDSTYQIQHVAHTGT